MQTIVRFAAAAFPSANTQIFNGLLIDLLFLYSFSSSRMQYNAILIICFFLLAV